MFPVDHRVRRGALLREMDDGLWSKCLERRNQKIVITDVADKYLDSFARQVLPHAQTVRQRTDWRERLRPQFVVPQSAHIVINNGDGMALLRQIEGRRPTAIAVPTEHGNLHETSSGLRMFLTNTKMSRQLAPKVP